MSKYTMLHPPLLERIYNEETHRGKGQDKAAKTRLHQMFGAYVQGNMHKKAEALLATSDIDEILALHASTKERLPFYPQFCEFVVRHAGQVQAIQDLGCGFNPFALHRWNMPLTAYHAYDIDTRTRDLLNRFFAKQNLHQTADCMDLAVETPTVQTDLALMCKLVPVLEAQAKGRGFQLANALDTKFLAITYPLQSLGGRNKGMGKNYAAQFETAINSGALSNFALIASEEIGNELVYVLRSCREDENNGLETKI